MSEDSNGEFAAFKTVHDALAPLDGEARARVIKSVTTLLGVDAPSMRAEPQDQGANGSHESGGEASFSSLAELFGATDPSTNSEKALVAGYWLQVEAGAESFTSQSVNTELRNLGHKIAHITSAIAALQSTKPQLVFQLKKSGTSQQARKTFKLSEAGIKQVQQMMGA